MTFKHHNFLGYGAFIGAGIGLGVGALLGLVLDVDPLDLGGIGLFAGFTVGAMLGDKVFGVIESYRAEIVREASLETQRLIVNASKLPDWWPTDEELAAALNDPSILGEQSEATIVVPSPRSKNKPVTRNNRLDQP